MEGIVDPHISGCNSSVFFATGDTPLFMEKKMSHLILVQKQRVRKNKRDAYAAALVRKQYANSNERV